MTPPALRVLILSTIPRFTLNLVRSAVIAGFQPFVLTDRQGGLDRMSRHIHHRVVIDREQLIGGDPRAIARINQLIKRFQIDVVVPADTRCTQMLARCGDRIQGASLFPLSSAALINQLSDKWQFAQLLKQHALPIPKTYLIETPQDVQSLAVEFPVIVKPPTGEGGKHNLRIDSQAALQHHIQQQSQQNALPLLLQEWIPGRDMDINLVSNRGELLAWSIQQQEGGDLRFVNHPQILEMGRSLCRVSGYHGVANVDLRVDERTGEVLFIEINPRFWATMAYSTWMGVNFLALGIQLVRDDIQVPAFHPIAGFCQYPWPTRTALAGFLRRGFQPPESWEGDRKQAWLSQILDPGPEWCDRLLGHQSVTTP